MRVFSSSFPGAGQAMNQPSCRAFGRKPIFSARRTFARDALRDSSWPHRSSTYTVVEFLCPPDFKQAEAGKIQGHWFSHSRLNIRIHPGSFRDKSFTVSIPNSFWFNCPHPSKNINEATRHEDYSSVARSKISKVVWKLPIEIRLDYPDIHHNGAVTTKL